MTEVINRKILDISHHNDVLSWQEIKAAGIVGVIHKATEATSYIDPTYESRREEALRHGLLWGAYHFATASDAKEQAEHFLSTTGLDDDEMLYALDWEDYGSNTMSEAQAVEFMSAVDEATGPNRCVLYSGNTAKEALGDNSDEFFGAHRYWLAQYSSVPVEQPSWDGYWLWQYSDGNVGPGPQGCPGVTGDVDTNSWPGTDEELRAQWSGSLVLPARPPRRLEPSGPAVTLRTTARVVSLLAPERSIVLVNGKLVGDVPRRARSRGENPP